MSTQAYEKIAHNPAVVWHVTILNRGLLRRVYKISCIN